MAEPLLETEPTGHQRRCIATRSSGEREGLLRFVVGPDGTLVFDVDGKLPGRGLWLSASEEAITQAVARNLFSKVARRTVMVAPDFREHVERTLLRRALDWLGLARRAGLAELGFEQVERAARAGELAVVVVATDAGADGTAKLGRYRDLPLIRVFTRAEMGQAMGRPSLVYFGGRPGRLAERLKVDAARLAGVRGMLEAATDGGAVGGTCQA